MKQKLPLLIIALTVSVFITSAQNFDEVLLSPGENTLTENEWTNNPPLEDVIQTFREKSLGILFMPIPLNIDEIKYTINGSETILQGGDLFNMGVGIALNYDFNKSGWGLGALGYFANIGGDNLKAYDFFGALKYDIPLGDRAETNFEMSPLLGIGNLSFQEKNLDLYTGNSFYFSGGVRITWRIINKLFLGADVQTVPLIFNADKLLGLENEAGASDAKIHYKFIAQLNLSLRYSIL